MPLWVGAGVGVASLISGFMKSNADDKAKKEAQQLYNDYLAGRKEAVNSLIQLVQANGYNPFGPQTTTTAGTSASQMQSTTQSQSSSRPTITPEYAALEGAFRKILEERLAKPASLPQGYETAGIRNINDAMAAQIAQERNQLARRNVATGSVIGSPVERSRASQVADFQISLPLLERELRNQDIAAAQGATAQFGKGMYQEGTSTTRGSTTGQTSGTVTSPPNLSALANLLLPPSPNAGTQTGISPTGQAAGDLGSALLMLYSSGAFGNNNNGGNGASYGGHWTDDPIMGRVWVND